MYWLSRFRLSVFSGPTLLKHTWFAGLGGCALPQIVSAVVSTLLSAVVKAWSRSFGHTETCGDLIYDTLDANLVERGTGGASFVGDCLTAIDGF